MRRLTRDGTAEPVSRDQIIRRERGQGKFHFPCLADHEQDCFKMTGVGTHTMIPRVVVVRQLGGLLCTVGHMGSLINSSSLHPWPSDGLQLLFRTLVRRSG